MLNKILITIISISILLFIGSCDRFEHSFEPTIYNLGLDEFQESFTTMWQDLTSDTILNLEGFVKDDYLNNDQDKDDFVLYFSELLSSNTGSNFVVNFVEIDNDLSINWNMALTDENNIIVFESEFSDYLMKDGEAYKLYGNQNGSSKIIAELFTGSWCTFCPIAEAGLYELKQEYSSRFDFVEYHINDAVQADGNFDVLQYYPNDMNLPVTILDGNFVMEGASEETYVDLVRARLDGYLNTPVEVFINNVTSVYDASLIQITCEVTTTLEDVDDLYLKYVLLDSHDDEHSNYNGEDLHNVVLYHEKAEMDLSGGNATISVTIENDFTTFEKGDEVLLWVQTIPSDFDANRTQIHNSYRIKL